MPFNLTISNDVTILLDCLYSDIKSNRKDFFDTFHIAVSSANLSKTIQHHFLTVEGVCVNLKFYFLEHLLSFIFAKMLNLKPEDLVILSFEKNKILLTSLIFSILLDEKFQNKYAEIFSIIQKKDVSLHYKKEYLWHIAVKLSNLFREYEYHRFEEIIFLWKNEKWAYGSSQNARFEDFEREIYSKIFFEKQFFKGKENRYTTLVQLYEDVKNKKKDELNLEFKSEIKTIYLFGFSQISEIHLKMLLFLKDYIDIKFFMPNYLGEVFASQNTFDFFQSFHFKVKNENGNERIVPMTREYDLIDDFNYPLIATSFLIKKNLTRDELFIKWKKDEKDNLLGGVKNLFLYHRWEKKYTQDDSLKIIACSSRYQEVEAVYRSIIYNIENNKDLTFDDILVVVPDLREYHSIINETFSRNPYLSHPEIKKNGRIPFFIYNKNTFTESLFNSFLKSLYSLFKSGFSKEEFINLLSNPLVMKKFNIDERDIAKIRIWIENLRIFDEDAKITSFSHGIKRTRLGLIMEKHSYEDDYVYRDFLPYYDSFTDFRKVDVFISVVEKLLFFNELLKEEHTFSEWNELIKKICEDFISLEQFPEEKHLLILFKRNLKLLDEIESLKSGKYSFDEYFFHISDLDTGVLPASRSPLFNGVSVSTFLQMKSIPFRIVYILGMNENEFPGKIDESNLNFRNLKVKYNDIDRRHSDNSLFIEAILNACDKVYISYVGRNPEEDVELYPSSTLSTFIDLINEKILKEEFKVTRLSLYSFNLKEENEFSDKYFTPHRILSLLNSMPAFYKKIFKQESQRIVSSKSETKLERLSLKSLAEFARNPVEEMLKVKAGIYDVEDIEIKASELRNIELENYEKNTVANTVIKKWLKDYKNLKLVSVANCILDYYYYAGKIPESNYLKELIKNNLFTEKLEVKLREKLNNILNEKYSLLKIVIDDRTHLDSENVKYFNSPVVCGVRLYGEIENVFFDGKDIVSVKYKKVNNKEFFLKTTGDVVYLKVFLSAMAYNVSDLKGRIIYIDEECKINELILSPLDRGDFESLLSYYLDEDNFHLLPLRIISSLSSYGKNEILEKIMKELDNEYSYFDVPEVIKMKNNFSEFVPDELESRVKILKKIVENIEVSSERDKNS
jgi:exonuclease V gamma subunit